MRRGAFIAVLVGAAALGVAATLSLPIAALLAGGTILALLALRNLDLVIGATLLFNMIGEPYKLALASVSLGGLNLYGNDLLLLVLAAAWILKRLREGHVPALPRDPISIVLLIYFGYGLFSLARSLPLHGAAAVAAFRVHFLYSLLFFLTIPTLGGPRSRRRLFVAVLIGAAVISVLGLVNAATGSHVGGRTSSDTYRYLSSLQALAIFFGLSLLIGVVWVRRRTLGVLVLSGLYLSGILISQARSIWLGVVAAALTAVFGSRDRRRNLVRLALPVGVMILALILVGFVVGRADLARGFVTRAASFGETSADVTTVWRLFVWTEALRQLSASPILGLGLGQQFVYFDVVHNVWEDSRQLHNAYLEIAYPCGFIAMGLFITFQTMVFLRTLKTARRCARAGPEAQPRAPLFLALAACQVCLAAAACANVVGASMVSTIYVWILSAASVVEARDVEGLLKADALTRPGASTRGAGGPAGQAGAP